MMGVGVAVRRGLSVCPCLSARTHTYTTVFNSGRSLGSIFYFLYNVCLVADIKKPSMLCIVQKVSPTFTPPIGRINPNAPPSSLSIISPIPCHRFSSA
jgi:hypothetical protein